MSTHGLPKLPEFIYISGSYALKYISNNKNIDNNDIDIYIHVSNEKFDLEKAAGFYNELLNDEFRHERRDIICKKHLIQEFIRVIHHLISMKITNKILSIETNSENLNNLDSYVSRNSVFLFKMFKNINKIICKIDIIFILEDIEVYMKKNFDLSICKNYIKSGESVVQLFSSHVANNISEYKFTFLLEKMINYCHIEKFIMRIYKYTNRGINIYLTKEDKSKSCYDCNQGNIKCEFHSVLLSKDNMDMLLSNAVNCILQYHKDEITLKKRQYNNKHACVKEGIIIIENLQFQFIRLFKLPRVSEKLIKDLIIVGINKLFLLQEIRKELSSPKYFDISILEED